MAITIYDYLASKRPQQSFDVLLATGKSVPYPRNTNQLAQMLRQYVQMGGEDALLVLAQIHPDKDLIEAIMMDAIKKKNEDFGLNNIDRIEVEKESDCSCKSKSKSCGCEDKHNEDEGFPTLNSNFANFCPSCALSLAFDGYGNRNRNRNYFSNFAYADGSNTLPNQVAGSQIPQLLIGVGILGLAVALIIKVSK
jgi:hypothetical protein